MPRRRWQDALRGGAFRWLIPLLSGLSVAGICALSLTFAAPDLKQRLDRWGEDLVLRFVPAPTADAAPGVVVIDIDSAALAAHGPWPWRRDLIARLIATAAADGAGIVAVDILFAGDDSRSPTAMARELARLTGRDDLAALVSEPDDDALMQRAMAGVPTVLGFVLSPRPSPAPRGVPVLLPQGAAATLWAGAGIEGPGSTLASAAAGMGLLALPPEADGVIRRVPLFAAIDGIAVPGLALEAARLSVRAPILHLDPYAGRFAAGSLSGGMVEGAMLRLLPDPDQAGTPLQLGAAEVLAGRYNRTALAGRIVLIGGSAPEIGAIRSRADGRPASSVEIQAQALQQLLAGLSPRAADARIALAVALLATIIGALLPLAPPAAALTGLGAGLSALGLLAWLLIQRLVLFAPLYPALLLSVAFFAALVAAFLLTRRHAALIRRRFEQHLAPQVVEQIVRAPHMLRQKGERRVITVLFTDLEGFSAMTRRCGPERLIEMLDRYFEGITGIVLRHGGMVDKIVGDAVHALFNAPIDQPNHAEAALRCALEIADWTETLRRDPDLAADGFGRTRIGIESGPAIVGDVGRGAKLDYTAHGDVINAAARLEAMNKSLGTTICAGPGLAAACPPGLLRPLTRVDLRGIGQEIQVYVPALPTDL